MYHTMCDLTNEVLIIIIATKPIVYKKKTQLITLSLLLNNDASLLYLRMILQATGGNRTLYLVQYQPP